MLNGKRIPAANTIATGITLFKMRWWTFCTRPYPVVFAFCWITIVFIQPTYEAYLCESWNILMRIFNIWFHDVSIAQNPAGISAGFHERLESPKFHDDMNVLVFQFKPLHHCTVFQHCTVCVGSPFFTGCANLATRATCVPLVVEIRCCYSVTVLTNHDNPSVDNSSLAIGKSNSKRNPAGIPAGFCFSL